MKQRDNKQYYRNILILYCLGLLVGGLYVGMVAPVRTVVQAQLGLDDNTGIWMINIYTLFYAALIPVIGKMADRYGRNLVFSICILVFMAGAAICGLSAFLNHFGVLLVGRKVDKHFTFIIQNSLFSPRTVCYTGLSRFLPMCLPAAYMRINACV